MSKMESKSDDVRVNRGGNAPRGYRGAGGGGSWRGPAPAGRGRPENARAPPPNRRGRENGSHMNGDQQVLADIHRFTCAQSRPTHHERW